MLLPGLRAGSTQARCNPRPSTAPGHRCSLPPSPPSCRRGVRHRGRARIIARSPLKSTAPSRPKPPPSLRIFLAASWSSTTTFIAPAISHALARLSATLSDSLLVRAGRRLVPTQRALAMRDEAKRVVQGGRCLLEDRAQSELVSVVRTLTVRANGSTTAVFASRLTLCVRSRAAGLNICFLARAAEGVDLLRRHGRPR